MDPWRTAPRTSGPLGINDAGDPFGDLLGDTPGALGLNDYADPDIPLVLNAAKTAEWISERGKELTKACEGNQGKPYWPEGASGITIGYGYDLRERSGPEVTSQLITAGVAADLAALLSTGHAKSAATQPTAKAFLDSPVTFRGVKTTYRQLEIEPSARDKLFELVYGINAQDVRRICLKQDVAAQYGNCDWSALHPAIKAVLIDLRFRGDYHPESRRYLQKTVARNDPAAFGQALKLFLDQHADVYARGIVDRFQKRIDFVNRYGRVKVN